MSLKEFVKSESYERYVALSTSVIAVALALSSILSNQSGDDLLIFRAKANNEWSKFQSKSIKQNVFETQNELIILMLDDERNTDTYKVKIQKKVDYFTKEIARYEIEKGEIKKQASSYEKTCEKADDKGNVLDLAEGLYQIAIVLSAISLIARQGMLWVLSMVLGGGAIIITSIAFFMP